MRSSRRPARIAAGTLTALLLAGAPAAGQDGPGVPELYLGATLGSLAGVGTWISLGGSERGGPRSTMLVAATTTLSSAAGAWLIGGAGRGGRGMGQLIPAAGVGVLGGMIVMAVAGFTFQSPEGGVMPLVIGFSVGQGFTTALLGRTPRRPR